ncbi:MAG: cell division protein ZipA [Gammaproteobacteria bacterium]|nr:cell division protein ZipA [Gammaproteobacteria bacterium]NIR97775.1 cell division protein ZipA [Gammaproteobacteria bacterium]NIT63485.1 cell division protein ZipA [Gammaproteobacteria bacterium]NIV20423.1 cell division protein ZipA [Gammaproteobacteria bacterium]NIX10997.1 cell division protein ZipA [Gammaproteobacteria bacterium]
MELFRWILLGIGVVILALIYLMGRKGGGRSGRVAHEADAGGDWSAGANDARSADAAEQELADLGSRIRIDESAPAETARPAQEKIVVVYVAAREGERFSGEQVLDAARAAGLEYGEMQIFHRYGDTGGERRALFSMANIVEPGAFDLQAIESFETPGLALFMRVSATRQAMDALEALFQCAEELRERLDGELRDATRSVLTRQTMDHLRDEVRELHRRGHVGQ